MWKSSHNVLDEKIGYEIVCELPVLPVFHCWFFFCCCWFVSFDVEVSLRGHVQKWYSGYSRWAGLKKTASN